MGSARIVVDTNVLVSYLLAIHSPSGRAFERVLVQGQLLMSEDCLSELADVLARPKFDPYVGRDDRESFLRLIARVSEMTPITQPIRACRDPKDDRFLELAVSGQADCIVSGDQDLLVLNPFKGIAILRPADYLASPAESSLPGD